ncbi:hypothetical protein [Salinimicrobium terrae]|uniref:hypothetical protein n=1 Tax=Salinimicrobium terrae TaxID=470866 RepID=UPI00041043D7|nr:hypothetical protein [Salinimicrobium terrae]
MKNFMSTFRFFFLFSFLLMVAGCSDPDEEVMQDLNSQINLEVEQKQKKANNAVIAKEYTVDLDELNNSGVEGTAELSLVRDQLTVKIYATGLEPDMPHPQHIHGFKENNKNAKCPTSSADSDGDGFVELGEGLPFYGPVLLPLTPFPTAPDGTIEFTQTYTVDENMFITPLQNNAIVLHGMTAELTQEVDGEIVVVNDYIVTLPVACGQIRPSQGRN